MSPPRGQQADASRAGSSDTAVAVRSANSARVATRLLLIGIAELLAILAVRLLVGWNVPILLLVHAAALAAIMLNLRDLEAAGEDISLSLLALIAGLATGPVGPIGAGLLAIRAAAPGDTKLLKQWYERISLSTSTVTISRSG